MTAQEMFEKLGFKKVKDTLIKNVLNWNIIYETNREMGRFVQVVFFSDESLFVNLHDSEGNIICGGRIDIKLHIAITQQMRELGWL